MKVILLKDIKALGREGELVDVSDGYARNYLFPKKLAVEANTSNMNVYRSRKTAREHELERETDKANRIKASLDGTQIFLKAKAGDNNKLFGAVTNKDIAEALSEKGIEIDKKRIVLDEPIKSLGTFEAVVKIHQSISAVLNVTVEKE